VKDDFIEMEECNYNDSGCNCQHLCEMVPCPNYIVCGTKNRRCILDCHNGHCMSCAVLCYSEEVPYTFDIQKATEECPICLEIKEYDVKRLHCKHRICSDCFKRCHLEIGIDRSDGPKFPYPKLENDYLNDNAEVRTKLAEDPLTILWEEDCEKWEYEKSELEQKTLGICAICRR